MDRRLSELGDVHRTLHRNHHDHDRSDDIDTLTVIIDLDDDYDDGYVFAVNDNDGPVTDDDPRYLTAVRACHSISAHILGTDNARPATQQPDDLRALRDAYIDARALFDIGADGAWDPYVAARDALVTALWRAAPDWG